ncbi:MAG: AraC family transcriptional regulator [Trueperaceae bacterium]|nr:AraC family transcriptional regulator [Trueperaceae bacterium]
MQDYRRAFDIRPSRDLEPYVAGYDMVETSASSTAIPGVALPTHAIAFSYGDQAQLHLAERHVALPEVHLRSVIPTPWMVSGTNQLNFFFVRLRPPTLYHLTRGSVAELTGQITDTESLSLRPSPTQVTDALRAAPRAPASKVAVVERYLRLLFRGLCRDSPAVVRALNAGSRHLDQLMARARRSERQLRRDFQRYVGISPKSYRDMLRIEEACARLVYPRSGNLTHLALDLGFYDLPHFDRVFARYAGMSPSAFISKIDKGPVGAFVSEQGG